MTISQNLEVPIFLYIKDILNSRKNLEAFPFHIPPDQAQRMLTVFASMICDPQNYLSFFGAYLSLPFCNSFRPARFSAVYFPAWFVNGEVEASITYKGVQVRFPILFLNLDQFTKIPFHYCRSRKVPGLTIRA
jgi:hypothetical protein